MVCSLCTAKNLGRCFTSKAPTIKSLKGTGRPSMSHQSTMLKYIGCLDSPTYPRNNQYHNFVHTTKIYLGPLLLGTIAPLLTSSVRGDHFEAIEACFTHDILPYSKQNTCHVRVDLWGTDVDGRFDRCKIDGTDGCRAGPTIGVPGMVELCIDWKNGRGHFKFDHQDFRRCFVRDRDEDPYNQLCFGNGFCYYSIWVSGCSPAPTPYGQYLGGGEHHRPWVLAA
ncbi:hypothetical protein B0H66DRAFT_636530 [Apodospora peruviana]|uniref:Uncharacterized protein n=1 Tax=Apodospora peruviana TaxID=516989 RepID=A0AAE0IHH4_9PEZI|nr:hypothetical protein B0H66DRAFT_636530 [Apodospora peruviana]